MATITLKGIPEDLRAQLEQEAAANFRSLGEEAMARLQNSFDIDARADTAAVDRLINEAIESGPEEVLTKERFDAAKRKARSAFQSRRNAA